MIYKPNGKTTPQLLRTPSPHSEENVAGYVLRLTESNSYENPSWVVNMIGVGNKNLSQIAATDLFGRNRSLIPGITNITNRFCESLRLIGEHQYKSVKNKNPLGHQLYNRWVPNSMLKQTNSKVCPLCLKETGVINRLWSVIPLTSCPKHRCLLVDTCPNCVKAISWRRSKVAECPCGYDLRKVVTTKLKSTEIALSRHIYSLSGLNRIKVREIVYKHKDNLYSLDLDKMLSLVVFTASYFREQNQIRKKFNISAIGNSELHELLIKGYDVYRAWPKNYYRFLAHLETQQRDIKNFTGLRKDFGKYHFYLYNKFTDSRYNFVREAFENYVATSWTGGYLRPYSYSKDAIAKAKYVTARQAAQLLKIKHRRIPNLVMRGLLKGDIRAMGSKTLCLVEKVSIVELKAQYNASLNVTQTARLLGTSTNNVVKLVKCNCLKAVHGPGVDGCGKWKISQAAIDDLFKKIEQRVNVTGSMKIISGDIYSMQKTALHLRLTTADLIKAVLDGEIRPFRQKAGQRLSVFEFSKKDIIQYKTATLSE